MSENDAPERIWISKYSGQRVRASEGALVDGIQEYVRADRAAPDAAREDERVKRLLAEVRQDIAETSPNSSPMGVFRQHCEDLLRVIDGLLPVQPAQQDDGWVTFGRIKTDIESGTETFERIPVQPAASTPTLEDILRERQAVGAVTMVGDVSITAAASTEAQNERKRDE